jgi:hypothetical protein
MLRTVLLIVAIISLFSFTAIDNDCLNLFKVAFEKMKNISPQPGKGLAIKYTVNAQTTDGSYYTDNIDMSMYDKKYKVISTDATIYQDDKTMVVVRPESNSIFVTRPMDQNIRRIKMLDMMKLQDSIFAHLILKNCDADGKLGPDYKKLTFEVPSKVQAKLGVVSVIYWMDVKKVVIKKVALNYKEQEGQRFKSVAYDFVVMDNSYTGKPFEGSAINIVMDAKNELKPLYKNYSVIDSRINN